MATKSGRGDARGLVYWREYFKSAKYDIFDIIEHAIMVAALDCPKEFKLKRERIVELLFSCRLNRCMGCDRVELVMSNVDDDGDHDHDEGANGVFKAKRLDEFDDHIVDDGDGASKGSQLNKASRDDNGEVGEMGMNMISNQNPESNFSYGDVEALTDEIEEQREIVEEVLRIKEILLNNQDESDSVLLDSLRKLQLMALNVDILKATEIGKAVNGTRKHSSKQIRHLARQLIDGWKITVDEWVKATQETAEGGTPDSINPSTLDEEEGLPSPPLDEGAFFATQTMDFSQFFDGMDDDGNPGISGESNKNQEVGRKLSGVKQDAPKRSEELPRLATTQTKDSRAQQMTRPEPLPKPNKPSNTQSGPGRPPKANGELKACKDSKAQQKPEKPMILRRPAPQPEKLRSSNEDSVQDKLEATKRKLQERYQQAEKAKRQRTIQVMELHDLPKQGLVNKNTNGKFGNRNRKLVNGRR